MPSSVQLIRSSDLAAVAEYAYAATAPKEARLVFLAGACPLDEDGRTVAVGDYAGQAAACVETMTRALAPVERPSRTSSARACSSPPTRRRTS